MNKHRLMTLVVMLSLALSSLSQASGKAIQAASRPDYTPLGQTYAKLNEVMAKPEADETAWVEILVARDTLKVFLPLISQSVATTSAASPSPDPSAAPVSLYLGGWKISNGEGQEYSLPDGLPPLMPGTFVLVFFDQQGPAGNDLDPSDGRIVLHTPAGLGDIFGDETGQAGLYMPGSPSPANIADFVAWGAPDDGAAADAIAAGIWTPGTAVSLENGLGDMTLADLLEKQESVGRFPGSPAHGAPAWTNYPIYALTPGAPNPTPPVLFTIPEHQATVDVDHFSLAWRASAGAAGYRVQIDDNEDFSSPLVNIIVTHTYYQPDPPLANGQYYWRVMPLAGAPNQGLLAQINPLNGEFYWTPVLAFRLVRLLNFTTEKVLTISRVSQNKDSYLLGLDGAPEGDPSTNTPEDAWDSPAPCTAPPCADPIKYMHGNMYCVRASIRMMASFYGGDLSMDRLSYYIIQEWAANPHDGTHDSNPDNDLGYNRGAYYPDEEDQAISWALNTSIATPGGKPTFTQIKDYINADRPIMFRRPGHMMVINGYRETITGDQFIHVLDPDQPPDFERWQEYATQDIDGYWPGPLTGSARSDEASVWTDSDLDGIMDFDEALRFSTSPYSADSDDDWVPDKQDMREYVFNTTGVYTPRASDLDVDNLRKERDADNDQDGSPDGCEDTNYNGIYQPPGETDNMNAASHQACVPQFAILSPRSKFPALAGGPLAPIKILVQVSLAVPEGWEIVAGPADFAVQIGGRAARVAAAYPSGDTFFLVVVPPRQDNPGLFDLSVQYLGGTKKTEKAAVNYESVPNKDEVVVLDRSGSMLGDDKISDAQHAANAFVDFLNKGDMVGVVSFATSSTVDYPLTEIISPTQRTDAKNAINALSADGSTALGLGVQNGFDQLSTRGVPKHDWSMVLLSDGWENVAPYWAEVGPTLSRTSIHTVALGQEADQALLKSIAESTGGKYFYVEVNPSTPLMAESPEPSAAMPLSIAAYLNNRLADAYMGAGEATYGLQRLFDQAGALSPTGATIIQFDLDSLPEAIFSLSWDSPAGWLRMRLYGPDGKEVTPDAEFSGPTHHILRVLNPAPGAWQVVLQAEKPALEYQFMLSGASQTSLIASVGPDPDNLEPGKPVTLYGILSDHDPISGASVQATILGPEQAILTLYDDGAHGDGKAKDGVYANQIEKLAHPGAYTVKMAASGTNNDDLAFVRYAGTAFSLHPLATYLWDTDLDTALAYEKLLEDHGWRVNLLQLAGVPGTVFDYTSLVLAGPDTGDEGKFDSVAAATYLAQIPVNILGLGEGGAALFEHFGLVIKYSNTWYNTANIVHAMDPAAQYWVDPYTFLFGEVPTATLYPKPLYELSVYLPKPPTGVTPIARESGDLEHYPVAGETRSGREFILWGYGPGPASMTQAGRNLLVNLAFALK